MIDPCPDTDPSALSPYGGSDDGDHNHDYSGSSAAKGRARGVPSSDREGGRKEGERGAISVLNCILDFSLSAIKSVERRGREERKGSSRRAAMPWRRRRRDREEKTVFGTFCNSFYGTNFVVVV